MKGISLRFWLLVAALLTILLLIGGGIEAWFLRRDSMDAVERLQHSESRAAAILIAEYLKAIERQVSDIARLPWASGALSQKDRQEEFHRLMMLAPAVFEMRSLDGNGRERLFVSRAEMDQIDSGADRSRDASFVRSRQKAVSYSPAYLLKSAQPYATLAVREADDATSAVTTAELNLKFVSDIVQSITIGRSGKAYVVDGANRLLAHPNLSLVLRNTDLSGFEHVRSARNAVARAPGNALPSNWAKSPEGGNVLVSAVYIPTPDWIVFVEQPEEEVLAPVRETLLRTFGLVLAGLLVAAIASLLLARRLTGPILQLQSGAARIGAGDLNARIDVRTGDELESLAGEFNRMAERLQESYAGLELKIEARTRELAEAGRELQQQAYEVEKLNAELRANLAELGFRKEEADRANAAKTRFLAAASHDLRQPMHAISLLVGILHDRIQYPEVRLLVDKVQMSVRAMENLFDSLLDISKLDAGIVKPNIDKFEIAGQLGLIELNYAPLATQKGIELRVVRSRAIVNTDAALLERIVGNLVSNAIRYTVRGRILVGCRRHGQSLQLLVFDTGIGIAPEYLDNIFEEFFQVANPESDRSKGLGLGLSIVKRSADLLGHRLIVESQPDKGSIFGIELPFVDMARDEPPMPSPESVASDRLRRAFLVVIDDDQENLFALEALCAQWGCRVVSASSAAQAIEKLADHLRQPDLIVSDFRLRDRLTGAAAVAQIRAYADALIPAIIVTGDLAGGEASRISIELVTVLSKPVNPNTLRVAAEALLATAEARDMTL